MTLPTPSQQQAQPALEVEPVAWRSRLDGEPDWIYFDAYPRYAVRSGETAEPLYTAQPSPAAQPAPSSLSVDWMGLALDLEGQAKRIESQTVERAMLAAANGLRLMGTGTKAAQPDMELIEAARKGMEALEDAHTGLMWYRGMMPEYVDGSDDEADEKISNAIAALRSALDAVAAGRTDGVALGVTQQENEHG
jgi:hypothetical protein